MPSSLTFVLSLGRGSEQQTLAPPCNTLTHTPVLFDSRWVGIRAMLDQPLRRRAWIIDDAGVMTAAEEDLP